MVRTFWGLSQRCGIVFVFAISQTIFAKTPGHNFSSVIENCAGAFVPSAGLEFQPQVDRKVVVPLDEGHFNVLVGSTAPIMNTLRRLLQGFYSRVNPSAEDLGITDLPLDVQQKVISLLKQSFYFEPKLIDPVFKDYPFIAVGGFDSVVSDSQKIDPVFFEFNGTPSGLSNLTQLIDLFRIQDLQGYATISDRLPPDNTFAILRQTIEDNARAWTGYQQGISVIISPGVYNAAHPDVAYIAAFTGMPLARLKDLYQDDQGWIRLNTGSDQVHPIVTGIYNRSEDSYLLESEINHLPFRKDSLRLDANVGSFFDAIRNRKLYVSNIGGRIVEDKRLFHIIYEHAKSQAGHGFFSAVPVNRGGDDSKFDWRFFVFQDSKGNIGAGPRSILLRISSSTDTLQRDGYGLGLVLSDPGIRPGPVQTEWPVPKRHNYIGASQRQDLYNFKQLFSQLLQSVEARQQPDQKFLETFIDTHRSVMELLGRDIAPLMSLCRQYKIGQIDRITFHYELVKFQELLKAGRNFSADDVNKIINGQ